MVHQWVQYFLGDVLVDHNRLVDSHRCGGGGRWGGGTGSDENLKPHDLKDTVYLSL